MFLVFAFEISSLQSSNRCAHLHESHRTLRDGSLGWRCPRHFVPGYDRCCPYGALAGIASASSHKSEAYRRRRFGRFSRRERRAYFDPYVRSEQRRKSAQSAIGPPNGFAVTPRRSRGSVTLPAYHAPESRASIASESSRVL